MKRLQLSESDRERLQSGPVTVRRAAGLADVNEHPTAWRLHNVGPLGYMAKKSVKGRWGATFDCWPESPVRPPDAGGDLLVCPCLAPFTPGEVVYVPEGFQLIHVSIDPETGYGDDVWHAEKMQPDDCDGYWHLAYRAEDQDERQALRNEDFRGGQPPRCPPGP